MHGASRTPRSTVYGRTPVGTPAVDPELESDYWGLHPAPGPAARVAPPGRAGGPAPSESRRPKPSAARRRDPLWARLCLILGAVLMMASGGMIVSAKLAIKQATDVIEQHDGLVTGPAMAGSNIDGAINLLLVGIDVGGLGRDGATDGARADTILIAHIPASHDQAYLVSIPRDLRVDIPADRTIGYDGGTDKINGAFNVGYQRPGTEQEKRARGVAVLANTIHQLTKIKFNGAAIIDFMGFEGVVAELGGVHMCIDQKASSIHLAYDSTGKLVRVSPNDSGQIQNMPKGGRQLVHEIGCRDLSADFALDYSRIRYGLPKTDYDRQRHQQQLIKAIIKKATSKGVLTDFGKLKRVMEAAGKTFVLDTNKVPIVDFLFTLKGVAANDLVLVKTNKGTYNGVKIDGVSYESLSEESEQMLHAVRDGKLYEFLIAHPEFVSTG